MTTAMTTSKTTDEVRIRKLIDDREKAVRAGDVSGSMANIVPDIVSFDVVNPLQRIGSGLGMRRNQVQELKWTNWGMLEMILLHANSPSIHASQLHELRISYSLAMEVVCE
jgi:hypothetical protein